MLVDGRWTSGDGGGRWCLVGGGCGPLVVALVMVCGEWCVVGGGGGGRRQWWWSWWSSSLSMVVMVMVVVVVGGVGGGNHLSVMASE
jgi:hypothetical protein